MAKAALAAALNWASQWLFFREQSISLVVLLLAGVCAGLCAFSVIADTITSFRGPAALQRIEQVLIICCLVVALAGAAVVHRASPGSRSSGA